MRTKWLENVTEWEIAKSFLGNNLTILEMWFVSCWSSRGMFRRMVPDMDILPGKSLLKTVFPLENVLNLAKIHKTLFFYDNIFKDGNL